MTRKDGVDFGPFTTEQVVTMIETREINLGTMICNVADRLWEPLGSYSEFRGEYARVEEGWASEAADDHARQLRTKRLLTGSAGRLAIIGALVFVSFAAWMTWRMSRAEPTGILAAVKVAQPPELPVLPQVQEPEALKIPEGTKVRRLREGINYDTSGVGVEGSGGTLVNTMSFDDDGNELSEAQLNKVVSSARGKLLSCAQAAAGRSERFRGTRVSFVVRSGGLGAFTVGAEASGDQPFKACVKRALKAVSVPQYGGSQRKVTIPLVIKR
ncbi:MAG: hypothetical protein ACPGU1_04815 [Myxococcota bacterium]